MFVFQLILISLVAALVPLGYVWRQKQPDKFGQLVWITTGLTFDLILFGSFTRLTDSGLGCPDWPGCYGTASPFIAQAAIQAAEHALPNGPVTITKAWIEMVHRYLAMTLGVLIIVQAVIVWAKSERLHVSLWWPPILLALVSIQGALGAWTVTLKLMPIVVTVHLLLAMALLGALGWFAASRIPTPVPVPMPAINSAMTRWQPAAFIGLILLVIQIALGGWVSANHAILACADFPTCHGAWLPPMDFAHGFNLTHPVNDSIQPTWLTQEALVAIHWTHRTFAWIVIAYLLWLGIQLRRFSPLYHPATWLMGMIAIQFATGLSNIVLKWPLWSALAHNGGASVLLLLTVMLNYRIASSRTRQAPALSSSLSLN